MLHIAHQRSRCITCLAALLFLAGFVTLTTVNTLALSGTPLGGASFHDQALEHSMIIEDMSEFTGSNYVTGESLELGVRYEATILAVFRHPFEDGDKPVLALDYQGKKIVCNKTKSKALVRAWGINSKIYVGKMIAFWRDTTLHEGKIKVCVVIEPIVTTKIAAEPRKAVEAKPSAPVEAKPSAPVETKPSTPTPRGDNGPVVEHDDNPNLRPEHYPDDDVDPTEEII